MNVKSIRAALPLLVQPAGFQAIGHVPEDVAEMPAALAGVPSDIDYGVSLGLAQITLPLTLVFNASDLQDAQSQMDTHLSTDEDTAVTLLRAAQDNPTDNWRSLRVVRAQNVRLAETGSRRALAVDIALEVLARK